MARKSRKQRRYWRGPGLEEMVYTAASSKERALDNLAGYGGCTNLEEMGVDTQTYPLREISKDMYLRAKQASEALGREVYGEGSPAVTFSIEHDYDTLERPGDIVSRSRRAA